MNIERFLLHIFHFFATYVVKELNKYDAWQQLKMFQSSLSVESVSKSPTQQSWQDANQLENQI